MGVPPIDWAAFSWEAFATLATGAAAVAAATFVGLRQLGIAREQMAITERQSRILERQVGLDELNLRVDLFEQRFAVYERARKFLGAIMAHADRPDAEIQRGYVVALDEARFLFRPEVHAQLREIWERSAAFFAVKSAMEAEYRRTGDYGGDNIDRERRHLDWLMAKFENLAELFGDELKLSAVQA